MPSILLIEDSKLLGSAFKTSIEESGDFEVVWVQTLVQTIQQIAQDQEPFFLALSDVNLPDSTEGEIIDFISINELASIVFTGTMDGRFRKSVWDKEHIIDYVVKSNWHSIEYVVAKCRTWQPLSHGSNSRY